ncbi:NapC/NirT family cytochrome c [Halorhodospira halochloris]|uniref:NapC/NirT family cytochrome c n=1 Tax=Halorhodospira halochloris TaxID=1052 RepID=UPI001EE85B1A|nr:NapC/NirT family cytochrome c [Halorhodospira halochloris]
MADERAGNRGVAAVLGFVAIGIVIGLIVAAGSATMVEVTNKTEYCVSCHIYDDLYEDYKQTAHYSNKTGYKAGCVDCHLPFDNWWNMVTTKADHGIGAMWKYYIGGVNTPEDLAERREELADSVFEWFQETNSKTCKSCHSPQRWNLDEQSSRAQQAHDGLDEDDGCIGCHRQDAAHPPTD